VSDTLPIEPWAKVPERVAYLGLDATALNVFIVLSSRAGRSREAWPSQKTIGDLLGLSPRGIGKAITRLERKGLVRRVGTVAREKGTWTRKYEVAPYLHVGTPGVPSSNGQGDTMGLDADPMEPEGGHDGTPGVRQSSASKAVPLNNGALEEERKAMWAEATQKVRPSWWSKTEEPHREQRDREATPPARVAIPAEEVARER
jgi:hypothetical protein